MKVAGPLTVTCLCVLVISGCAAGNTAQPAQGVATPTTVATVASPSTSRTAAPTPTPTPTPDFQPRTATINVSGDLLWHNTLWYTAQQDAHNSGYNFAPQLASVKPYISRADLAICHNEVPVAPAGGPYRQYPRFASPPQVAAAIKATGWDMCTTASNHSMDGGWNGLVRTIKGLQDQGILTTGTFTSAQAAATPVIFTTTAGVKIAVISQTYGLNGLPTPQGKPWAVNLLDAEIALAQAHAARKAGADIVAVHMHAGDEYATTANDQQRAFATKVTASADVDFVFGEHAHVVQPIDKINNKWVIYGTGNLIAQSGPKQPYTYDGYIAQVTFTEQPDHSFAATAAEFAPTMITKLTHERPARVLLIADALQQPGANRPALLASANRTSAIVNSLGVTGLHQYR